MKNQLLLVLHYETVLASFERFSKLCAAAEFFPNPSHAHEYMQGLVKQLKSVPLTNDEEYQRDQIFEELYRAASWVENSKDDDGIGIKLEEIVHQYGGISSDGIIFIKQKLEGAIDSLPESHRLIYQFLQSQKGAYEPFNFDGFCTLFEKILKQVKSVSRGGTLTASEVIETIAGDDEWELASLRAKQLLIEDILDFCASHFNLVAINAANYRGEVLDIIKKHLMNNPQAKDSYKAYMSEELCDLFYRDLNRTYPIVFDLQKFVKNTKEKLKFATIPEQTMVQAISEALKLSCGNGDVSVFIILGWELTLPEL
jgi:hypothetical protein